MYCSLEVLKRVVVSSVCKVSCSEFGSESGEQVERGVWGEIRWEMWAIGAGGGYLVCKGESQGLTDVILSIGQRGGVSLSQESTPCF